MTLETIVQDEIMEDGIPDAGERGVLQGSSGVGGAVAAAAMSFILVSFGVAIGLGVSSASPTWRDASAALALLSALYLIVQAIVSFGFGGYIAGRTARPMLDPGNVGDEGEWRDGLHASSNRFHRSRRAMPMP